MTKLGVGTSNPTPFMKKTDFLLLSFIVFILAYGCKEDDATSTIEVVSSSINGYSFEDDLNNIPKDLKIEIVFGKAVDLTALKSAISIESNSTPVEVLVQLSNAGSKATIEATLDYNTSYVFTIASEVITGDGASLEKSIQLEFRTLEDHVIRSMAPCRGTVDCLESVEWNINGAEVSFWVYANYPFDLENAAWEDLKQAIIVVHGQNRDADNYYQYLSASLDDLNLSESTLLIAPWFRDASNTSFSDMYWSSSAWREGGNTSGSTNISSFVAIDSLLGLLNNKNHFPVMENVIITGHSSGAMLTDMYAWANSTEELIDPKTNYVVANSQYFYYPLDYRYNESTQTFYIPEDCSGYNSWPYGFTNHPSYISGIDEEQVNNRFAGRSLTYLLGNDTSNDPALNTTNCKATLLGSSRYQRGENRYAFMNEFFPENQHSRVIVESIGHDGEGMYKSDSFKALLTDLIK